MCFYKIDDGLGKIQFFSDLYPVFYVADDDLRTLFVRKVCVGIHPVLVLCKERRICHFTDVVVQSSGAYQLRLGSNAVCRFGCEIRYLHRMLECTRACFR